MLFIHPDALLFVIFPSVALISLLYHLSSKRGFDARNIRNAILLAFSVLFYALSAYGALPVLALSIASNYVLSLLIGRFAKNGQQDLVRLSRIASIAWNLGLLAYFKYLGFLDFGLLSGEAKNFVFGSLVIPLGISFFTFQQIAYHLELAKGKAAVAAPLEYAAFVAFYPQLLAGPISLHTELLAQLRSPPPFLRYRKYVITGAVLFAMGVAKKVYLADIIGGPVNTIFEAARSGANIGFVKAWTAAVGYLVQIYFDFSGYADMALGLALMLGFRLAVNFDSPLKAASMREFWQRWHMTLTRFMMAYVYLPISMALSKWGVARGLGKHMQDGPAMIALSFAIPSLITFLLVGIWHGPALAFAVYGLIHGVLIVASFVWSYTLGERGRRFAASRSGHVINVVLTNLAIIVSLVEFRTANLSVAVTFLKTMGLIGSASLRDFWPLAPTWGLILVGLLIIHALPNSVQIVDQRRRLTEGPLRALKSWEVPIRAVSRKVVYSTPGLFIAGVAIASAVFVAMGNVRPFIYFDF